MNHDSMSMGLLGGMFAFISIIVIAVSAFFVWCFWRIFERAGFNGALGLLCLIPSVGVLVCILILAFSGWPSQSPYLQPPMPPERPIA